MFACSPSSVRLNLLLTSLLYASAAWASQRSVTLNLLASDGRVSMTTLQVDTEYNPISAPAAGELLNAGSTYTIRWTKTSIDGQSFDLCRLTAPDQYTRVERPEAGVVGINEPNTGSYVWAIPDTLRSGNSFVFLNNGRNLSPMFRVENAKIPDTNGTSTTSTGSTRSAPSTETRSGPSGPISSLMTTAMTGPGGSTTSLMTTTTSSDTLSTSPDSRTSSGLFATTTGPIGTNTPTTNSDSSSASPALIGGAVGGALGAVILGLLIVIFFFVRRRRRGAKPPNDENGAQELDGKDAAANNRAELAGEKGVEPTHELAAEKGDGALAELPLVAERQFHELPAGERHRIMDAVHEK